MKIFLPQPALMREALHLKLPLLEKSIFKCIRVLSFPTYRRASLPRLMIESSGFRMESFNRGICFQNNIPRIPCEATLWGYPVIAITEDLLGDSRQEARTFLVGTFCQKISTKLWNYPTKFSTTRMPKEPLDPKVWIEILMMKYDSSQRVIRLSA